MAVPSLPGPGLDCGAGGQGNGSPTLRGWAAPTEPGEARQEVGPSEAGGCKMTLGPERKTSGCSGECGEPNGGGPRLPSHSTFVQTRQSSPLAGHGPSPAPMAGGQRESGLSCLLPPHPLCACVFVQDATYPLYTVALTPDNTGGYSAPGLRNDEFPHFPRAANIGIV